MAGQQGISGMREAEGVTHSRKTRAQLLEACEELRARVAEMEQEATKRRQAEDALARERDLLHTLMDHIPDTIYFKDEQSRFTRINRAQAEVLGVAPGEAVGKTDFDFFEPDHARSAFTDEQTMLRTGQGVIGKGERMRRADGEHRWISTTKVPIRGTDGRYHGIVGISRDVTAQKQAEEDLRQSEERYRGLIESQQDLIVRMDRDGPVTFVNEAFVRMFGRPRHELIGMPFLELAGIADGPAMRNAIEQLERPPHRTCYEQGTLTASDRRWIEWEIIAIHDEHGRIVEIQAVGRDITGRKQAEAALQESEQRLAAITANVPGAVYRAVFPPDGRVVFAYISPGLREMIGADPEQILGDPRRGLRYVHPDDRRTLIRAVAASVRTLHSVDMEYRLRTPRGDVRWVRDLARLHAREDGNVIRDGVILDVSRRKRMEEEKAQLEEQLHQAQKMEALGQLAAGVAHDFSNLLTIMLGGAEQLRRRVAADVTALDALSLIEHAAEEAKGVTRSLLSFSRRVPPEKQPLDLARFLNDTVRFIRRILPASIDLTADVDGEGPFWVSADSSQLHLVILNLVINARDAMPNGGRLHLTVGPAPPLPLEEKAQAARAAARVIVQDTGAGMAPEVQRRIFEPFYTTKPRGTGTGLGLAIALGIVHEHNGAIDVSSRPGLGSAFTVTLPCVPPDVRRESDRAVREPRGAGQTILLAEDDRYIRRIITSTLQALNYRVIPASDGVAAVERFHAHRADIRLLILDLDLPKRSGFDCVRDIRATGAHLPVILITSHAHVDLENRIDENSYVLPKPFQMAEIGQLVAQLVTKPNSGATGP
jgi:PAS domain S-box-containing protein